MSTAGEPQKPPDAKQVNDFLYLNEIFIRIFKMNF